MPYAMKNMYQIYLKPIKIHANTIGIGINTIIGKSKNATINADASAKSGPAKFILITIVIDRIKRMNRDIRNGLHCLHFCFVLYFNIGVIIIKSLFNKILVCWVIKVMSIVQCITLCACKYEIICHIS